MKTFIVLAAAVLTGASALAADMPVKAPPAPPAFSWTGFYAGLNVGYGWEDRSVNFTGIDPLAIALTCGGTIGGTCVPPVSVGTGGALGGLQAGYNWQINRSWLLGVETDFDFAGIKGSGASNVVETAAGNTVLTFHAAQNVAWFGTVRGRVGFLPTDSLLIYATGGFAYGRVEENAGLDTTSTGFTGLGFALACNFPGGAGATNCLSGSSSRTATGYTVGAGAEYALGNHLSIKAEYLYVDLGHGDSYVITQAPTIFGTPSSFAVDHSRVTFNVVRAGLNWKF